MSTLLTTTSTTRPETPSTGNMYFETDTGRIIIYGGSGWSQYSPAGTGESVDDSGEINITYGTFDEILAVEDKTPGDLFYIAQSNYVQEFSYTRVPGPISGAANNSFFYITNTDDEEVHTNHTLYHRLTANSGGLTYYVDMDQANWGTPDWQGAQNLADNLTTNILPAEATAIVSGDNNETVTITSPNWFIVTNIPSDSINGYLTPMSIPEYKSDSLIIYTGLDEYDNEVFSQLKS